LIKYGRKKASELARDFAKEIQSRFQQVKLRTTPEVRSVRKEFSRRLADSPPRTVVQLALKLVGSKVVPRYFAYELILHNKPALRSLTKESVLKLGVGLDTWGDVDAFACLIAGPAWREGRIPGQLIKKWALSRNHWWRRAAAVSTVPLNKTARGGRGDSRRTLQICSLLSNEQNQLVVKALSWALRELARKDPRAVQTFINKHQTLAAWVKREVGHKLSVGLDRKPAKGERRPALEQPAGYSGTPLVKKLGIKDGFRLELFGAPKSFLSPKQSSGVPTDLTFSVVQRLGLECGLVDVKICAIDQTWSGLKFVYRLKDRLKREA